MARTRRYSIHMNKIHANDVFQISQQYMSQNVL